MVGMDPRFGSTFSLFLLLLVVVVVVCESLDRTVHRTPSLTHFEILLQVCVCVWIVVGLMCE